MRSRTRMTSRRVLAALALPLVALVSAPRRPPPLEPLATATPFEVLAHGFADLRGIVVDESGRVHVVDHDSGTLVRVGRLGDPAIVATGLDGPVGLALAPDGALLVAEERGGRVVRVQPGGSVVPVADGLRRPRWLATGDGGVVYVSAGSLPADRTSTRSPAICSRSAAAICERPALCTHTKRTLMARTYTRGVHRLQMWVVNST